MPETKKIIYVDWKQWESGQHFLTAQSTEVRVKRASIPIVFVPGIMGSRLKKVGGDRVWDPNSLVFMSQTYYNLRGAERKKLLIDSPLEVITTAKGGPAIDEFRTLLNMEFYRPMADVQGPTNVPDWDWLGLPPATDFSPAGQDTRLNKIVDILMKQGWEQLAWSFYGKLLLQLAAVDMGELKRSFMFPVYVVGYNWIEDNRKGGDALAARVKTIISGENRVDRECDRVILVSHSMGGLVTRAAAVLSGCGGQVQGIVHGAQPATGAPAAYRRMRAGFEYLGGWNPISDLSNFATTRVMGKDAARVVPILANCVGGLELLPTSLYKNNKQESKWLKLIAKDGTTAESLPQGNPYDEIYRNDKDFLALVRDPGLLNPGATPLASRSRKTTTSQGDPRQTLNGNLATAESFHKALQLQVHPHTFVTYTSKGGPGTFDEVRYKYARDEHATKWVESHGEAYEFPEGPMNTGSGTDLDSQPPGGGDAQYFTIENPDGAGDGTVPVSSSSALAPHSRNAEVVDEHGKRISPEVSGAEHSGFFDNEQSQKFTIAAIRKLAFDYRKEKIGK